MIAVLIIGAFFLLAGLFGFMLVADAPETAIYPDADDDEL